MRQLPLVVVIVSLSALLILLGGRRPGKVRTYKAAPSTSYTDAAVGAVSSASEEISDAAYGAFEVLHSAVDAAAEVVSSPKAGEDPIALATAGFRAAPAQGLSLASREGSRDGAALQEAKRQIEALRAEQQTLKRDSEKLRSENEVLRRKLGGAAAEQPAVAVPAKQCNRDHSKVLTTDDVLCRVPKGELAFVTLANQAYGEMAVNWALLLLPMLERLGHGDRAVIAGMDQSGVDLFLKHRLPTVTTASFGGIAWNSDHKGSMDGFRWKNGAFRAYGVTKAEVVLWLLRAGRDVSISDVDVAWIAPPYALLRSVPDADVLSGTDCLNVPYDADRSPRKSNVRNCGHQSGSTWSAWFNTGVMFFRARPAAIDMMAEWRDTMAEIKGEAQVDDQLSFNQLVGTVGASGRHAQKFRRFYPLKPASEDGRVVYDGNGSRRIHAIPVSQVCSAHVFHVQQSAEPRGCLVLHLTFVEGWPKNPAKYWRLREAGMLPVRPEPFDQRYLSFTPPQPGPTPPERHEPAPARAGNGWTVVAALQWSPRLKAHLELVDRHIAALRNAIGIARALGRQLVMPRMACLCERAESPAALLPGCTLEGASTPVPHVCPLESVYDVARVERIWQKGYLQLRPWTFLNSSIHKPPVGALPFTPADTTAVRWLAEAPPHGRPPPQGPRQVWLEKGLSAEQLLQAVSAAGASDARVVHLESAEGVFGGFESAAESKLFKEAISGDLLGGWSATWCCTSWNKPAGTFKFKRPVPLPSGVEARGPRTVVDLPDKRECYWQSSPCEL